MSFGDFLGRFAAGFTFGMLTGGTPYGWCSPYYCSYYYVPNISIYTSNSYYPMSLPEVSIMPSGGNWYAQDSFSYLENNVATGFEFIKNEINNPESNYNKNVMQPIRDAMKEYYENLNNGTNTPFNFNPKFTTPYSCFYSNPDISRQPEEKSNEIEPKPEEKAKETPKTNTSTTTSASANRTTGCREFAQVYSSLGIKDERFIKIFEECVLKSEGRSYIFDVHAMAKNGVQQGTYNTYRESKGLKKQDVKYMTAEEMCDIYYGIYKDCEADKIKNDRMALYVYDLAVNSGSKKAKEYYAKCGDNPEKFLQMRKNFYLNLINKDAKKYGGNKDGWMNRLSNLKKYADNNFSAIS